MNNSTYVRVKSGVLDEELGNDMGGWCGRISSNPNHLLTITWDGPTLCRIPDANIRHCIFVEGHMLGMDHLSAPIADMVGLDARKKSTKLLEWYRVWFANR